jgi:hypothetical protein
VLRAPPPIIYIDDAPLHEILEAHELYVTSDGRDGAAARIPMVDFRPMKRLKGRKLAGLSAPGRSSSAWTCERRTAGRQPGRRRPARRQPARGRPARRPAGREPN